MFQGITVVAPAKINVGLHVFPKRSDGYHDIESIFTTVNLCDTIEVELIAEKNTCSVACEGMKLPDENTFTAAYKAFCVLTGCDYGCSVKVTKRIPTGGGLGGGSSNASSFIKSIDMLCGSKLSAEAMNSIAAQVGSDVFFFTNALIADEQSVYEYKPYTALVTGRGENVKQIPSREELTILLVFPGVFVSTKEAYSLVDEQISLQNTAFCKEWSNQFDLSKEFRKPVADWQFVNDFTAPVSNKFLEIQRALVALKETGALFADMSGSGATVFGVFEDTVSAQRAKKVLDLNWKTVLV